jgi:heterodisulfide reductase subunit A-like polyferredoxin
MKAPTVSWGLFIFKMHLCPVHLITMGKQLVVIGGGAAGFFCAVNAARMNPGLK